MIIIGNHSSPLFIIQLYLRVNFFQNIRIGRAESEIFRFAGVNPAQGVVFQRLGDALGNNAVKQRQADENVRVFVFDLHEPVADVQLDGQFLHALPLERLRQRFARFHFAAGEFPEQSRALFSGRWQIRNLSLSQISPATTSIAFLRVRTMAEMGETETVPDTVSMVSVPARPSRMFTFQCPSGRETETGWASALKTAKISPSGSSIRNATQCSFSQYTGWTQR